MSSNAAGFFTWKQAILLRHFGSKYPVPDEEEKAFFDTTPKQDLAREALETLEEPLRASGIDTENLRLGTMFTSGGSRVIPGTASYGTPRELLRWLVHLEQGKLVDEWSSSLDKTAALFCAFPLSLRFRADPAERGGIFQILDRLLDQVRDSLMLRSRVDLQHIGHHCDQVDLASAFDNRH